MSASLPPKPQGAPSTPSPAALPPDLPKPPSPSLSRPDATTARVGPSLLPPKPLTPFSPVRADQAGLPMRPQASDGRTPSLPPPLPFASTSAPVDVIDQRRESFELPKRPMSPHPESKPNGDSVTPKPESDTPPLKDEDDESHRKPEQGRSFEGSPAGADEVDEKPSVKSKNEGELERETRNGNSPDDDEGPKPILTAKAKGKRRKGQVESEPQLIGHLPSAEEAASATYTEISDCTYYSQKLGNTPYYDPDSARCDCVYRPGEDMEYQACGDLSQCMNRLMQIECEAGDCRCGRKCQNQRFQKKQYAPIEVVQTEKKGFGVRASENISADTFIYEYVGEVIGPTPFAKKMKDYANEGIKHFYFMALDKEVFIDATKKGGKGRFLNHSCNPNCQVAKWTVGKKMRMGIFAKRDIAKNEELTFNYNVDRYGHVAQECFCGEPNCVGFIGGKTQTDIGGMDDLYIDALGIAEEVEALGLKGSKRKKGKKLDEDFTPTLHPIQFDEVPKVSSAIRQALQTRRILEKLLQRVQMTEDEEVQRQLLRLHGLSLMSNILKEYPKDSEVIILDLEIMTKWKFQTRNKIETSKIEDEVKNFVENAEEKIATLAKELLATWGELELGFRIPKAQRDPNEDPSLKRPSVFDYDSFSKRARTDDSPPTDSEMYDRTAFVRPEANKSVTPNLIRPRNLPRGWSVQRGEDGREYYLNTLSGYTQWETPTAPAEPPTQKPAAALMMDANALVAEAERAAREAREEEERKVAEEKKEKEREREERHRKKKEEKEAREKQQKDKKVLGLFSGVVVATMSKYRAQFEPEAFKKRAKEVTQLLLDKEKKRPTYDTDVYETLAPEKEAKVKSFVKDWVKKLLERKKGGRSSLSSSSTPRTSSLSKTRPSASTSNSSTSTPKVIDSPATPHGPASVLADSPMIGKDPMDLDDASNGLDDDAGGTPSGSPPRLENDVQVAVVKQLETLAPPSQ
ncbi:hypothetical protein JCM10212_000181 [Sporobolomyces blumeae]